MSETLNSQDATLGSKIKHYLNGRWVTTTLTQIKELFDASASSSYVQQLTTRYETPVSASTITLTGSDSIYLLLTPTGTVSSLTIKLPASPDTAADNQQIKVFSTQQITTLTFDGNGATNILGEPSTMALQTGFTLRYNAQNKSWYRDS